jgi:hypothetical protein
MFDDICDVTLSINFAKSEDGYSEPYSPSRCSKNADHYRCFKCYGTSSEHCSECSGTEQISHLHPMAQLLNNVLMKRLNNGKSPA